MNNQIQYSLVKRPLSPFYLFICILVIYSSGYAQENPPRPIQVKVNTLQHLSFGTFIQGGNYGTVTVDYTGTRTASGSIILPGMYSLVTPALFEITAIPGTLITISNGPTATLTSSSSGTLSLTIGASSKGSPFITTGVTTLVYIGGTLVVKDLISSNPAGLYSGTFDVTFIQQ